jgi:hypothetical protein
MSVPQSEITTSDSRISVDRSAPAKTGVFSREELSRRIASLQNDVDARRGTWQDRCRSAQAAYSITVKPRPPRRADRSHNHSNRLQSSSFADEEARRRVAVLTSPIRYVPPSLQDSFVTIA